MLGAQDPVRILQGDYFRFFTPIFLHGGLLHFAMNSMAIYVVGRDLEPVFGSKRFLLIFLCSGICGSVASAALGVNQSVGASGAIFGLLGAGLVLEKSIARHIEETTGERQKRGPYMGMLIINMAISFLPMIDTYAHFGGFLAGAGLTYALFKWMPNRLLLPNRPLAVIIFVSFLALLAGGFYLSTNEDYIFGRYLKKVEDTQDQQQKLVYLSSAIEIKELPYLLIERGMILLHLKEARYAITDFKAAIQADQSAKEKILTTLRDNAKDFPDDQLQAVLREISDDIKGPVGNISN